MSRRFRLSPSLIALLFSVLSASDAPQAELAPQLRFEVAGDWWVAAHPAMLPGGAPFT